MKGWVGKREIRLGFFLPSGFFFLFLHSEWDKRKGWIFFLFPLLSSNFVSKALKTNFFTRRGGGPSFSPGGKERGPMSICELTEAAPPPPPPFLSSVEISLSGQRDIWNGDCKSCVPPPTSCSRVACQARKREGAHTLTSHPLAHNPGRKGGGREVGANDKSV